MPQDYMTELELGEVTPGAQIPDPNDPFGVMEQQIRARLALDPETRAKKKMADYLKETWGIDPAKGKQVGRKIGATLGEMGMMLGGAPRNRRAQFNKEALEEYKAEAPILRTQMDVLSAQAKAARASQDKAAALESKAATEDKNRKIKEAQLEINGLLAQGKYGEALARSQKLQAEVDLIGEQAGKVSQETKNLANTGGLTGEYGAAEAVSKKSPLAAKAWEEANAMINRNKKLGKFPPTSGLGSTTVSTPAVRGTDPASGNVIMRPGTSVRTPGTAAPQAAPQQQEEKVQSPIPDQKTAGDAPVRVMPRGFELMGFPASAGEAEKIRARGQSLSQVSDMARGVGNWYADGKLDFTGFLRNLTDTAGFNVRKMFSKVSEEEQAFQDWVVNASMDNIKSKSGVQFSDRERKYLESIWPSRLANKENLTRSALTLQLILAGGAWRDSLGLNPIESSQFDLSDKTVKHVSYLMRKLQQADRLRRTKGKDEYGKTAKDYRLTADDLNPQKIFMDDLRNAFPEDIQRPDGSGLKIPRPGKKTPAAKPSTPGRVLRGQEALDLLK
jgi:hypothetical protein